MPRLILGVFISSISLEKCLSMERNEGCYVCGDFCDCCFFTDVLIKGEFPDDMRIGYRKRHIGNMKEIVEACHGKGYFTGRLWIISSGRSIFQAIQACIRR